LGLAEKGKGYQLVRDGVVMFDGELPVNVSGGLKAKGHPVGATGIGMMVEMFLQLRGEAGERQVAKVERTLVENHGGTGSVSVVALLSKKEDAGKTYRVLNREHTSITVQDYLRWRYSRRRGWQEISGQDRKRILQCFEIRVEG